MGGLPAAEAEEEAPEVDVSAEGTLVWLRRPNGTWWPSIVISPLDVPEGCPAPPRCPAVPIMLLGRRDGTTTYVYASPFFSLSFFIYPLPLSRLN